MDPLRRTTTIPSSIFSRFDLSHKPQSRYYALEFPQIEKELAKNKGGGGNFNSMRHSLSQVLVPPKNIAYAVKHSSIKRPPEINDKMTQDRLANRRVGTMSRDVSHLFDKPLGSSYHSSERPSGVITPVKNGQKIYKLIEKDLISIYRDKEILTDPKLIEQSSKKLVQRFKKVRVSDPSIGSLSPEQQFTEFSQSLGVLSSRKQVEILSSWLNHITTKVQAEQVDRQAKLEKLLTIHKFVILEICRQVSVQCSERGELLQKAMDQYGLFMRLKHSALEENMQQIRKDHMNETSILQNEIKEMQAKILSLQKENELHKADVAEKEDTINYLREVREQITKQNEELLAEIRKAANNSKAESTAGSPVTREQLVKKRKNKTKPVIERTKRPAIPLNRIKFTGSLVPQHVFAFNVQQEIFKEKMDPENLVVESKVLRIDYNQGKLNVESKEVPMDKETIEKGRRMMLKSRTYAKLTTEFNDFLKLSSTNVKNQPQITKKSFTLINPERVVQQIENIPNEGTEISLMPAIKEPQIIIMQDINKEVPHDLRALLEEKDRIIESLRADNKSLVERLQNRRASMRRKSALGPTDSHSDNEEGEFLDPNFYGDPNKEGLFLFYEETEPTTIESEGKIRGRPDRSKLLLDKILAQANVGNVKVNSRMIHKFVNKVYQEVIATYKESLETLDTPFHLKRPLVF